MFRHQITVQWSEPDGAYVARVPALGAMASGNTPDKAVLAVVRAADTVASDGGEPEPQKNPAAVSLGRAGGLKGGKARAASLTKKTRSEIAKKAAAARWGRP